MDTVVIHKDMGQYSGEKYSGHNYGWVDDIVEAIHLENETVRVGIISGEYPDGMSHVESLGADFYLDTADTVREEAWFLQQLRKGTTSPREIGKRGKEVATPPNSSTKERRWW